MKRFIKIMKRLDPVKFGYIETSIAIDENDQTIYIDTDFGEYAEECNYQKDWMENELDAMWPIIVKRVEESGVELGNEIESEWDSASLYSKYHMK